VFSWRRNLFFIWASQFLAIMGFAFALPFAPYYMQELGVTDPARLRIWVAVFAAATPLSLAIFSPIWGALADRYGRRAMLLRANLAGAVVLVLMGTVRSVEALVFLRLMQGVFTGTMTAAQAMVASDTPDHRSGVALGTLSAAVFSGAMVGSFVGGVIAHWYGYRCAFLAAGLILLAAALLVMFGTRENWVRPETTAAAAPEGLRELEPARAVLLLILVAALVRQFDTAYLPLLVQEINGGLAGASVWTGLLSATGGVAGLLAGVWLGRLTDRTPPPRIGMATALGAAAMMVPQALARAFPILFVARFGNVFCAGGLDPVFQVWLSRVTPESRRGFVFGWAGTARSVGWMLAPLASGAVAAVYGIRVVFWISSLLFLLLIGVIALTARGAGGSGRSAPRSELTKTS